MIKKAAKAGKKLFALLIDPDRTNKKSLEKLIRQAERCHTDLIFVGSSYMAGNGTGQVIEIIKRSCHIPVVIFPGSIMQIDKKADAILFLSLISGRNADLLIGKHVQAAPLLKKTHLEVIPTGYMVIESGRLTSVQYMSGTLPLPRHKTDLAACTALAGQLLGMQVIYMDAGSGACRPASSHMIKAVKQEIILPLIVGGGIDTPQKARKVASAGADVIVVGNSIEKKPETIFSMAEAVHSVSSG
jgi:putative glycerol-1-phosphate prenyltransferase